MNLLFTPDLFQAQETGGISRYILDLAQGMADEGVATHLYAGEHRNALLAQTAGTLTGLTVTARYRPADRGRALYRRLANGRAFDRFAAGQSAGTVIHESYFDLIAGTRRHPRVVTLHDMESELAYPATKRPLRSRLKRRALRRAAAIIAVSQTSADALADIWPDQAHKVHVIRHARPRLSPPAADGPGLPGPYLLFVGRRGGYKNFARFLTAFARTPGADDVHLLLFGGGPLAREERDAAARLGVGARLHHRGGDDAALSAAYRDALALVYPSRLEGFGFPLLEAMAFGTPVFCSDIPIFREVAGPAACFAATDDPDATAEALDQFLTDSQARQTLVQQGSARLADFAPAPNRAAHRAVYDALAAG